MCEILGPKTLGQVSKIDTFYRTSDRNAWHCQFC